MLLFPHLLSLTAEKLVRERCEMSLSQLEAVAGVRELSVEFTPIGGERVRSEALLELRSALSAIAVECGYPGSPNAQQAASFDSKAAVILMQRMQISASEASSHGVWTFITCLLVPDLVRWRFMQATNASLTERYLGGRRNAFQRLWWRAYLLGHGAPESATPVDRLLEELGEDELVQLAERPRLAGISGLSVAVAEQLLAASRRYPTLARRTLIREAQKRLLRLTAFIAFEALAPTDVSATVSSVFDAVASASGVEVVAT